MIKVGLIVAAVTFATGAMAQPRSAETPLQSEQVSYADLNLDSKSGQAVLRHRIVVAAGRVCDTGGMLSMEDFTVTARCYRAAYDDGLRQMNDAVAAKASGAVLTATAIVITGK